jgi:hypothetical protein
MYWNNSWLSSFNHSVFFNKVLFLDNFFSYLFSERIFSHFFLYSFKRNSNFFKKSNLLEKTPQHFKNKLTKYNFTKLWFIKYNNFVLLSNFCFFFFKIRGGKNKLRKKKLFKIAITFFKKRRSNNFKKKQFFLRKYNTF